MPFITDDLVTEGKILTREEMARVIAAAEKLTELIPHRASVELPWEPFDPLNPETWKR